MKISCKDLQRTGNISVRTLALFAENRALFRELSKKPSIEAFALF